MPKKKVTVIGVRADRKQWDGDILQLTITDLSHGQVVKYDKPLAQNSSIVEVNLELPFNAGQVYGVEIDADDHRAGWQLIKRQSFLREEGGHKFEVDQMFLRLMVIPHNPISTDLDKGYDLLVTEGSPTVIGPTPWPKEKYLAMGDPEKMAFLNIDAKLRGTRINGIPIRTYVQGVGHVGPARVFCFVRPELKDLVAASPDFSEAPGHKNPPKNTAFPLPGHPDSWKHEGFGVGNLQLSFSKSTMPLPGDPNKLVYSVDADIDLEKGLGHVFEWLTNEVLKPGQKTDQTLVYGLLYSQGVIPHYTLRPVEFIG